MWCHRIRYWSVGFPLHVSATLALVCICMKDGVTFSQTFARLFVFTSCLTGILFYFYFFNFFFLNNFSCSRWLDWQTLDVTHSTEPDGKNKLFLLAAQLDWGECHRFTLKAVQEEENLMDSREIFQQATAASYTNLRSTCFFYLALWKEKVFWHLVHLQCIALNKKIGLQSLSAGYCFSAVTHIDPQAARALIRPISTGRFSKITTTQEN